MPATSDSRRRFAIDVVKKLRAQNFIAYFAGGCVRDQRLGRPPKDYDVATDATPDQVRKVFGYRHTFAVGAAFGVITVVGPKPVGQIDVATFRSDDTYSDGRRPDSVAYSTPEIDAQRRDFTINGLFYDPLTDEYIDYVDGQSDLDRGLVRAIGDPRKRFSEDKLRLLRAVRFAATYGFTLDTETANAVREMSGSIIVVSAERIAQEMRRMLTATEGRSESVRMLQDLNLLSHVLPEWHASTDRQVRSAPSREESLDILDALDNPTLALSLAALLRSPTGSNRNVSRAAARDVCRRWKLSNHETDRLDWLLRHDQDLIDADTAPWSRVQPLLIHPGASELLQLHRAVAKVSSDSTSALDFCDRQRERPAHELDPPPLLTGEDLKLHGLSPGPDYKRLLREVRDAQLDQRIQDKASALAFVDKIRDEGDPH